MVFSSGHLCLSDSILGSGRAGLHLEMEPYVRILISPSESDVWSCIVTGFHTSWEATQTFKHAENSGTDRICPVLLCPNMQSRAPRPLATSRCYRIEMVSIARALPLSHSRQGSIRQKAQAHLAVQDEDNRFAWKMATKEDIDTSDIDRDKEDKPSLSPSRFPPSRLRKASSDQSGETKRFQKRPHWTKKTLRYARARPRALRFPGRRWSRTSVHRSASQPRQKHYCSRDQGDHDVCQLHAGRGSPSSASSPLLLCRRVIRCPSPRPPTRNDWTVLILVDNVCICLEHDATVIATREGKRPSYHSVPD